MNSFYVSINREPGNALSGPLTIAQVSNFTDFWPFQLVVKYHSSTRNNGLYLSLSLRQEKSEPPKMPFAYDFRRFTASWEVVIRL